MKAPRDGCAASASEAPPQAPTSGDVELFRHLIARTGQPVESELRGTSMEDTIPAGSLIRILHHEESQLRRGEVVAFLAGSRVMVHRIVYRGRHGSARGFVITQGDGNWLCDPPVELAHIAGSVEEFHADGRWKRIGPARMSLARSLVSYPTFALLRLALEFDPALAARLGRAVSLARMRARRIWLKLSRRGAPDVRD